MCAFTYIYRHIIHACIQHSYTHKHRYNYIHACIHTYPHTGGRQNNGNTKKLRNRIFFCVGYIEGTPVGKIERCTVCLHSVVVRVSALMILLSDSPCERMGKWKSCPILKEDRPWVRV
jgi:hypothetical protein